MNQDLVFAKTREGEEAVHQRTRLVQRNLRTVLILIDGKSTVGELVSKAGSGDVLMAALEQLERDGFIRLVSGEAGSKAKGDADPMANYLEPATDESFPSIAVSATPKAPFSAPIGAPSVNPFAPPAVAAAPRDGASSAPIDAVSVSPFSIASPVKPAAAPSANPFQNSTANPFSSPTSAPSSPFGAPAPKPVSTPKVVAPPPEPPAPVASPITSFKRRVRLLSGKRVAIGVVVLVLAGAATAVFYPYDSYRPRIEASLSALAGQPVQIASVSASFLPSPALVLSQVAIGTGSTGGAVTIAEVRAVPGLTSLFSKEKSFSRVTLKGTQVPMAQLGLVASGLSAAGQSTVFSVGRLDIEQMTLALRDISFQDYSGRAELAPNGELRQMTLHSKDKTMSIQVGPGATDKSPTQVLVQGQGWKSGEGSPFVFDSLSIAGSLAGTRFVAEKIEGRIFGGVIQGQLALDWGGGIQLAGDVNVDYMNAPQLAAALGSGTIGVEGQASARVRFRASGESWNAISGKVPLEGSFITKTGVINGLDFVEAVRRGNKLATRGGATRYEQMVGKFRWDGDTLQMSDIDLTSGVVRATGALRVAKSGALSGSVSVLLQSSAASMRTPVAIVGTVKDPQLFGGRN